MSNVLDKSFIHRSYPKLAYGSIYSILSSILRYVQTSSCSIFEADKGRTNKISRGGVSTRLFASPESFLQV